MKLADNCKLVFVFTFIIYVQTGYTQQLYFPDSDWQTKRPASLQVCTRVTGVAR